MTTSVWALVGITEPLASGSLPRVLVNTARPINSANASVHVFKYLRNGEAPRLNRTVCLGGYWWIGDANIRWLFQWLGFINEQFVNCFHLSIPVCGGDI